MNQNLTEYIRRYISISETEIELFQSFLKPKKLKKKEFLLKEGGNLKIEIPYYERLYSSVLN